MRFIIIRQFLPAFLLAFASLAVCGRAAELEGSARDVLVYKDGDRLQGKLLAREGNMLVFKSDRFGELRVPADGAVVIKAEKPVEALRAAKPAPVTHPTEAAHAAQVRQKTAEHVEEIRTSIWERFSPAELAAKLRDYFGPWHGRLAFSTEVVSDTAERSNLSLEGRLKRKWKFDEVQLGGRYDFSQTNELTTTDLIKADASWRHDFGKKSFTQYRPTFEWNRASFRSGVPADYVLLQQEIGFGVNLLAKPERKLRVGVSENLFDTWNLPPPRSHNSRTVESAFVETELRLPWGMLLSDRGVYYYSFSSQDDGWENRVEVTKKFTETLSTAIRHEIRRGSPDGTTQDYTRLKLLFGLDF